MKTAEHIIETVDKLVRKYHTRDPYELCQLLGIKIHYYDLQKKLKGFFYYQSRQKNIVIDHNVNGILERILVAHELGHAVLHTKIAMMHGFQEMEVFDDRSIEENEANFFAAELLLEDGKVLECLSEHTFFETAKMLYVPAALLDYKFSLLHEKGELVNSMYTRVTLIHQDILQFQFPNKQRYKIVGSIPYHLSTQIIKKVVFESHASDIYLIVEEGFYKRTLDIHRTLGLLLHTQVSIQQLLKLPAECFHPKPKVNSVLIKLTRHTTDVPDKYWKLYTYFVSKWVNREYRQLFTKNQFHQAMKHAKVNNLSTVTYEQVLSIFNSYLLFNGRK